MLKKKMVGSALCLGILTGGGTFVGNMPVQAAGTTIENTQEFEILEGNWKIYYEDRPESLLINDCRIFLDGYSTKEIMEMLDLKKDDRVQVWVTGDGSIRESYPGQLTGKVFKLRNMANGKVLETQNMSTATTQNNSDYEKISNLIAQGAISSEVFSNKTTQKDGGWVTGQIAVNNDGTYFVVQNYPTQPNQYVNVNLEGYTNQQIIAYFNLKSGDTISVKYEYVQQGNPLTLMATSIKKIGLSQGYGRLPYVDRGSTLIDPPDYIW